MVYDFNSTHYVFHPLAKAREKKMHNLLNKKHNTIANERSYINGLNDLQSVLHRSTRKKVITLVMSSNNLYKFLAFFGLVD